MSAGWYPRRRGILEHLEHGAISLLDSAVHDFLCLIANHRTGVAWASAEKIRALCPQDIRLKAIQRSLQKLERIGWLKRFRTHGKRGNYPVVIGKYFVRDASLNWLAVNLEKTCDWRNVQFDRVTDTSFVTGTKRTSSDTSFDSEAGTQPGTEANSHVSPVQEVRRGEPKKETEGKKEEFARSAKTNDDATQANSFGASPQTPSSNSKQKQQDPFRKFPPRLRVWADTRILRRAGAVRSTRAYLRASRAEFARNLDVEVEEFLIEQAEIYLNERLRGRPTEVISWAEVAEHLGREGRKHDLPTAGDMYERCTRAASERLGYVEQPMQPN
jgi:hypothetical protein